MSRSLKTFTIKKDELFCALLVSKNTCSFQKYSSSWYMAFYTCWHVYPTLHTKILQRLYTLLSIVNSLKNEWKRNEWMTQNKLFGHGSDDGDGGTRKKNMWKNKIVISSSSKKPYTLDYMLLCDTMMTTPVHRDNITTSDMTRWHWHHLNLNKLYKHHKKLSDWLNEWSQTLKKMNGYLCRDHFLVIIQSMHVYLSILHNDNDK